MAGGSSRSFEPYQYSYAEPSTSDYGPPANSYLDDQQPSTSNAQDFQPDHSYDDFVLNDENFDAENVPNGNGDDSFYNDDDIPMDGSDDDFIEILESEENDAQPGVSAAPRNTLLPTKAVLFRNRQRERIGKRRSRRSR